MFEKKIYVEFVVIKLGVVGTEIFEMRVMGSSLPKWEESLLKWRSDTEVYSKEVGTAKWKKKVTELTLLKST